MNRETPYTPVYKRALFALLSTCLVLGMLPTYAFGSGETPATAERPAIVSEEVAVGQGSTPAGMADDQTERLSEGTVEDDPVARTSKDKISEATEPSAGDSVNAPVQVTAEVPVSATIAAHKTLLIDGLEYVVAGETGEAALVGWYGTAPKGDLVVPSQVSDGVVNYDVIAIGESTDGATNKTNESSNKTSDASSKKRWGGVHI